MTTFYFFFLSYHKKIIFFQKPYFSQLIILNPTSEISVEQSNFCQKKYLNNFCKSYLLLGNINIRCSIDFTQMDEIQIKNIMQSGSHLHSKSNSIHVKLDAFYIQTKIQSIHMDKFI